MNLAFSKAYKLISYNTFEIQKKDNRIKKIDFMIFSYDYLFPKIRIEFPKKLLAN